MKRQIVIAWTEVDGIEFTGGLVERDRNYFPEFVLVPKPRACMWKSEGDAKDLANAKEYAAKEGYQVFTYPSSETAPLERAKQEVMALG